MIWVWEACTTLRERAWYWLNVEGPAKRAMTVWQYRQALRAKRLGERARATAPAMVAMLATRTKR